MKRKQKYRHGYYLLHRIEEGQPVWQYDYFQNHEVKARIRQGWKIA